VVKSVKGFHNWVTLDHRNQHWPILSTGTTPVFLEINGVEISRAGNDERTSGWRRIRRSGAHIEMC
jgi:hypothetical protein